MIEAKVYTPEEIAKQYRNTMDSVNLINGVKPIYMSDADWVGAVKRNKEHIKIMIAKDYWTTEDLTPFEDAVKA